MNAIFSSLQRLNARIIIMSGVDFLEKTCFTRPSETLVLFSSGPITDNSAEIACGSYGARFQLEDDLSPLFPYINAVADRARFYDIPVYIKFVFENRLCAFYSREGAFAPVNGMAQALEFLAKLLDFIANISRRSPDIIPNHKKFKPSSALNI
jgi:hypothetical protein